MVIQNQDQLILTNLSVDLVKMLNKISELIKPDFNSFVENIIEQNNSNVQWLTHPLVSRNPHWSDLFVDVCYVVLTLEVVNENSSLRRIITINKQQKIIIEKHLLSNDINGIEVLTNKQVNNEKFFKLKSILKLLKKSFKQIYSRDKARIPIFDNYKEISIIDTFILENSISKGKYVDRYFPGLHNSLSKEKQKTIFWVPTILGDYNNKKLNNVFINSKEQFIYKHDILKPIDYIKAFCKLYTSSINKKYKYIFRNIDLSALVIKEFNRRKFIGFESVLNYYFYKRLKQYNAELKLFIDWYENQPIDKGSIIGIRKFFPNTVIRGYLGGIVALNYNFYLQPTDYEIKQGVIPDEICVLGPALEDSLKKFSKTVRVSNTSAFRFVNKIPKGKINSTTKRILVALPVTVSDSVDILNLLSESVGNINQFEIIVKPHPAIDMNSVMHHIRNKWRENFSIMDGDFYEVLGEADVLIGSSSSTVLEALSNGIPTIITGSKNGITLNPIPDSIDNRIWKLVYTEKELTNALKHFTGLSDDLKNEFKDIGRTIKKEYFNPVTHDRINSFLSY